MALPSRSLNMYRDPPNRHGKTSLRSRSASGRSAFAERDLKSRSFPLCPIAAERQVRHEQTWQTFGEVPLGER